MPELPDVETVVRMLRRKVGRRRIRQVRVLTPSTIRTPAGPTFIRRLRGRTIRGVDRRGKYVLIRLDSGATLAVHLRMTGDFAFVRPAAALHPHTRVVFEFSHGELRFVDQRRFGHMDLVPAGRVFPPLQRIGIEPLGPDFTVDRFRTLLHGRRGTVKSVLLRQDLIAGIGNLYADEILWQARILPAQQTPRLKPRDVRRLHRSIQEVLWNAIRGLLRYRRPVGRLLEVRERDGHCPRCGRLLSTRTIAGRTTYFCSFCQRA